MFDIIEPVVASNQQCADSTIVCGFVLLVELQATKFAGCRVEEQRLIQSDLRRENEPAALECAIGRHAVADRGGFAAKCQLIVELLILHTGVVEASVSAARMPQRVHAIGVGALALPAVECNRKGARIQPLLECGGCYLLDCHLNANIMPLAGNFLGNCNMLGNIVGEQAKL